MDGIWTIDEQRAYTGKDPLPDGSGAKLKQPVNPFAMPERKSRKRIKKKTQNAS